MARPKTPTVGSETFRRLMPEHGDQKTMAKRIVAAQDDVSRWASGERKPSITWRSKLLTELEIPLLSWDEPLGTEEAPPASEPAPLAHRERRDTNPDAA